MSKLVLRNISRKFGDYTAVQNFDLSMQDGELVSLLGPSGCGKTTTLRMIAGFMTPTEGTIELDGEVISSPESSLPPERASRRTPPQRQSADSPSSARCRWPSGR